MSTPSKRPARRRKAAAPRAPRPISPAKWASMTNPQKAVAIAKDALWRVSTRQLEPTHHQWCRIIGGAMDAITTHHTEDMQALLRKGVHCECCALGGAIIGLAAMEDQMSYWDTDYDSLQDRLEPIFGADNLRLIEYTFENGGGRFSAPSDEGLRLRADAFADRYPDVRKRFVAIWSNVAANKGTFVP